MNLPLETPPSPGRMVAEVFYEGPTDPCCGNCGDRIHWARMPGGHWCPIDPQPHDAGHILMLDDERAWPMSDEHRYEVLGNPDHPARGLIYIDHRRSCSQLPTAGDALLGRTKAWVKRAAQRSIKLEREFQIEGSPPSRRGRYIKPAVRRLVYERDGHACVLCGATDDLTLDHIFPVSEGGSNHAVNLRVLCRSCNSSKGTWLPDSIRLLRPGNR